MDREPPRHHPTDIPGAYRHVEAHTETDGYSTSSSSLSSDDIIPDESASRPPLSPPSRVSARSQHPSRHDPHHYQHHQPHPQAHQHHSNTGYPGDFPQAQREHSPPLHHPRNVSGERRGRSQSADSMSSQTSSYINHDDRYGYDPYDDPYRQSQWYVPQPSQSHPPYGHAPPHQGVYDPAAIAHMYSNHQSHHHSTDHGDHHHRRSSRPRPRSHHEDHSGQLAPFPYYYPPPYPQQMPPQMPPQMQQQMQMMQPPIPPYMVPQFTSATPSPAPAPAPTPAPPTPAPPPPDPKESVEFKALHERYQEIIQEQARKEQAKKLKEEAEAREKIIRREAHEAALAAIKAEADAEKKKKEELGAAEKAGKEKADKAAETKAAKLKEENEKKAAEEKQKFEEAETKRKALEEEVKKMKPDPDSKKAQVNIKDSVFDRTIACPWLVAKSWTTTRDLLITAFQSAPELAERIQDGRFELVGPERQIILPSVWEITVQPGWNITVMMPPLEPLPPVMGVPIIDHVPGRKPSKHGDKKKGTKHKSSKSKSKTNIVEAPMPSISPHPLMAQGVFGATPPLIIEEVEEKKHRKSSGGSKKTAKSNGVSWNLFGGRKK